MVSAGKGKIGRGRDNSETGVFFVISAPSNNSIPFQIPKFLPGNRILKILLRLYWINSGREERCCLTRREPAVARNISSVACFPVSRFYVSLVTSSSVIVPHKKVWKPLTQSRHSVECIREFTKTFICLFS